MTGDIDKWCKQCEICQRRHDPISQPRAPLQQLLATRPGEIVHADIMKLAKTPRRNKYVLVLIDAFTKFVNIYPISNQRAETVADII